MGRHQVAEYSEEGAAEDFRRPLSPYPNDDLHSEWNEPGLQVK
jgi:hypothetical protein